MHLSICNFTYHSSVKEIGTQDPTNRHVFNRYLNSNFEYYQSPLYELATRDLKAAMIGNPIYSYCSPIPLVEFCRNSVSSYIKPLLENEVLSSRTYTNIIKAFTKRETPFRNMVSFLTEFVIDWDDEYHHIFSHLAEKMLLETPDAHLFSFRDEIDAFLGRIHIDHTYALNASWFEAIKKNLRIQNIFSSPNSAIMDNGHINFDFVREQLSNEQLTDNEIARAYCRRLVRSASSHPSANNNPYSTLNGRYEFNGQDLEVNTISDEYLKSSVVALSDGSCLDNVCTYIILQKMLEQGHIVEHEDVHHPTIWSLFKDAFQDMCYLPIDIYNLLAYLSYVFCITTCSLMPKNLLPRSISLKRDYRSVTGYQKSQSPTPFSEISVLLKQN